MRKLVDEIVTKTMEASGEEEEYVNSMDECSDGQEEEDSNEMEELESENRGLTEGLAVEEEEESQDDVHAEHIAEEDAGEDTAEDAKLAEDYEDCNVVAADSGIELTDEIVKSRAHPGKFIVRMKGRLTEPSQTRKFIVLLQDLIDYHAATGKTAVFEDFDISQNSPATTGLGHIFYLLAHSCVHVERLRAFAIPTLNDDICTKVANWLASITASNVPLEMHLSHCAISNKGFNYIMEALKQNEAFPGFHPRHRCKVPMYLRLQNNYIKDITIQKAVESHVLMIMHSKDEQPCYNEQAKARLLNFRHTSTSAYQQNQGEPPKPQDAPPKQINCRHRSARAMAPGSNSSKGKGTQKSGKGKTSKGSAEVAWPAPHKQTGIDALPPWHKKHDNSRYQQYDKKQSSQSSLSPDRYSKDKSCHRDSYSGPRFCHRHSSNDSKYSVSKRRRFSEFSKEYETQRSHGCKLSSSNSYDNSNRRYNTSKTNGSQRETRPSQLLPAPRESCVSKRQQSENLQPKKKSTEESRSNPNGPSSKNSDLRSATTNRKTTLALPAPWEEHWSDKHGQLYYWSSETGESQWERPSLA